MYSKKDPVQVKVRSQEVVAAALPMQEHRLQQSNLDLMLPPSDVGVFFCYKNSPSSFESKVGVLREALARTLVSYYVFAGEMAWNDNGEPELLCNNCGVDFLDAFADIEQRDLNMNSPDESLLIPWRKRGLLVVQATELRCGGLIIGCKFDHRVADAHSANMFFESKWEPGPAFMEPSFQQSLLCPQSPAGYDSSIMDMYVPMSIAIASRGYLTSPQSWT